VKTGTPHRPISESVRASEIDLVVIPTHGRSGVAHVLFGSVAEKVVRSANCPILTIRPEQRAERVTSADYVQPCTRRTEKW
jgi:nucleotide-binding universal stress UspA family protein